jgi:hypothetical protein
MLLPADFEVQVRVDENNEGADKQQKKKKNPIK